MVSSGAFNWVLVVLSAVGAAVGIAAWVRHRGMARLFLALTALCFFALFLIPTIFFAPLSGEQQVFDPAAAQELESAARTVYEIVPVLLVLSLAALIMGLAFLLAKRE
jgi:hypothetical protein